MIVSHNPLLRNLWTIYFKQKFYFYFTLLKNCGKKFKGKKFWNVMKSNSESSLTLPPYSGLKRKTRKNQQKRALSLSPNSVCLLLSLLFHPDDRGDIYLSAKAQNIISFTVIALKNLKSNKCETS
jgi:hypothetical protein